MPQNPSFLKFYFHLHHRYYESKNDTFLNSLLYQISDYFTIVVYTILKRNSKTANDGNILYENSAHKILCFHITVPFLFLSSESTSST